MPNFVRISITIITSICILLLSAVVAKSDVKFREWGIPIYQNVTINEMPQSDELDQVLFDTWGRMLILNDQRIYSYDGNVAKLSYDWLAENSPAIDSIDTDSNGRMWACGPGIAGELIQTEDDFFELLPFEGRDVENSFPGVVLTKTYVNPDDTVYFFGRNAVIRRNQEGGTEFWDDVGIVSCMFHWDNDDYLYSPTKGILKLYDSNEWLPSPIMSLLPEGFTLDNAFQSGNDLILLTDNHGLFVYDYEKLSPIKTDIDHLLANGLKTSLLLPDNGFALVIPGEGMYFLDKAGKILGLLPKSLNASFSRVTYMNMQADGTLWAVAPDQILKITYPIHLFKMDEAMGMNLSWTKVNRYKGKLLLSANTEVQIGHYNDSGQLTHFELLPLVDGLASKTTAVVPYKDALLVGANNELWYYTEKEQKRLSDYKDSLRLYVPKGHLDTVLVISTHEAYIIKETAEGWIEGPKIIFPFELIFEVFENEKGEIWMEGGVGRVMRILIDGDKILCREFNHLDGLQNYWINLFTFRGDVVFHMNGSAYIWDENQQEFILHGELAESLLNTKADSMRPVMLGNGDYLLSHANGISVVTFDEYNNLQHNDDALEQLNTSNVLFKPDGDSGAWITTSSNLYYFSNDKNGVMFDPTPKPLITQIAVIRGTENHILYQRAYNGDSQKNPLWGFTNNRISISVFINDYRLRESMDLHYRLEGFDEEWHNRGSDREISFTNLREGKYRLHLLGKNDRGRESLQSTFEFTITPPWYRSILAYAAYVVILFVFVFLLVARAKKKEKKEKEHLEKLVAEKTVDLNDARQTAEKANEAKSLFLANMSHEIRTPMNAVLGMTHLLSKTELSSTQEYYLNTIQSSGKGLLNIINDVLDLSHIETGKFLLRHSDVEFSEILDEVMESFAETASKKNITLSYWISDKGWAPLKSDRQRIQQVLINLIGNALKFTERGSVKVDVIAGDVMDGKKRWIVSVRDTGIGISKANQTELFKSFYQVDSSLTRKHTGNGLGLSICNFLIEKFGGSLEVKSRLGVGSEFEFSILAEPSSIKNTFNPYDYMDKLKGKTYTLKGIERSNQDLLIRYFELWGLTSSCNNTNPTDLIASQDYMFFRYMVPNSGYKTKILFAELSTSPEMLASLDNVRLMYLPVKPQLLWDSIKTLISSNSNVQSTAESTVKNTAKAVLPASTSDQNIKILIAEDIYMNQVILRSFLEEFGYKADVVEDGHAAVQAMKSEHYDIILMDVQMPNLDGRSATMEIRADESLPFQPWIIAQSAGVLKEERDRLSNAGVDGFLGKPFVQKELKVQLGKGCEAIKARKDKAEAQGL